MGVLGAIVVLIIVTIFVMKNNNELKAENKRLYAQLKQVIETRNEALKISGLTLEELKQQMGIQNTTRSTQTSNAQRVQSTQRPIQQNSQFAAQQSVQPNAQPIRVAPQLKPKKSKEETKNNFILMTGAFLIVLAAIVFLTSMWDTIGDVFKVGILTLLVAVFLGISKVAKDVFKLPNTSNTFFYIAMAYIPVLALAIFLINLSSGYIQTSQQQNIFWLIACLIMGTIYGIISLKSIRRPLFIGSMIMQILAVIFGTLIYTDWIENILITIGIYNLILTFVNLFIKQKKFCDIIKNFNIMLFKILVCVTLLSAIVAGLCVEVTISLVFATLIQIITAIVFIIKTKEIGYLFVPVLGAFLTVLEIINLENTFDLSYMAKQIIMLITTLVLFAIGMISKIDSLKSVTKVTTCIFLTAICTSTFDGKGIATYIVLFIASLLSMLMMKLDEKHKFGYLHTAIILFVIGSMHLIGEFIEHSFSQYILLAVAVILYVISLFVDNKTSIILKVYTNITLVISMIILSTDINVVKFILNIVSLVMFNINTKKLQASEYLNIIPIILLIPSIYISDLFVEQAYIMQVLSIVIISCMALLSIKDKKFNLYTVTSYIYLIAQISFLDVNKYINIIVLGIVSSLQALSYNGAGKNIAKLLFYLSILLLYNTTMSDLGVEMVTILALGYIVVLGLISRDVVYEIDEGLSKAVQYIGYFIIYSYIAGNYINSSDALLFMGLLIGMIIFTYSKKLGPIFLCSVLAEIGMAFIVTKEFWKSIPWWIYLLVIGGALLSFAVRNEVKEKTEGNTLKDTIKKLSDKLDM